MPKPEEVLAGTQIASERLHPNLRIPITFRTHPIIDGPMQEVDDGVKQIAERSRVNSKHFTWSTDMPKMGARLFDSNRILEETLHQMGINSHPEAINFCHLQSGAYASHLFYEAIVNGNPERFVAYVSRFPNTHGMSRYAESDYRTLKELESIYSTLPKDSRLKYDVATPYTFGHAQYKGRDYPVFTTKFEESGELGSKFEPIVQRNGVVHGLPIFRHPIPIGDQMVEADNKQVAIAGRTVERYKKLIEKNPNISWETFVQTNEMQQDMRFITTQQRDIVRAAAVPYVASGGMFMPEFQLNSGDFMTTFEENGFGKITLITARGGLRRMNEYDWMHILKGQKAVHIETEETVPVFAQLSESDYLDILDETIEMLQ